MYYLMVKYALGTGLKYLCQTSKNDPYSYKGSGVRWTRHIRKHKSFVVTWVVAQFKTLEELKMAGEYYSKFWNIVESNKWANLVPERGDGGDTSNTKAYKKGIKNRRDYSGKNGPRYNQEVTIETRRRMSKSRKGRKPKNFEQWKMSAKNRRYIHHLDLNLEKRVHEHEIDEYLSDGWLIGRLKIYKCKYCNKICDWGNYKRYHDEKCKWMNI